MRVAIITESFAPEVNGVSNSVMHVLNHLIARGHDALVIAPEPSRATPGAAPDAVYPVVRVPSLALPFYATVRLGLPSTRIRKALEQFEPDVVHLASPFVLGAWGSSAAARRRLPTVAVYQTDVPGYAATYGLGLGAEAAWRWIVKIHARADLTLAPSTATAEQLRSHGVQGVRRWGRGVDTVTYHPRHRDRALRRELLGDGDILVGYVGRLAKEKCVELLAGVADLPGVRLVVVGDGPARPDLMRALPRATFTGLRRGADLARLYASLDVFVHTGPLETFGQTIQEAQASGVPVIAPASGGPLDLITEGVTGYLVTPGDANGFADAVAALAAAPRRRAEMGRAARAAVKGRTWSAIGDELLDHYRTAMRMCGTRQPAVQMELAA